MTWGRLIDYLMFAAIGLLPLAGMHQLNFARLGHMLIVVSGFVFLFIRYRATHFDDDGMNPDGRVEALGRRRVLKLFVFIYCLYVVATFYPSGRAYYDAIVMIFAAAALVVSVAWFVSSCARHAGVRAAMQSEFDRIDAIFILGTVIIAALATVEPVDHTVWEKRIVLAGVGLVVSTVLPRRLAVFAGRKGRGFGGLTLGAMGITVVVALWGTGSVARLFVMELTARRAFEQGRRAESGQLYAKISAENWLRVPLGGATNPLQLAQSLADEGETEAAAELARQAELQLDTLKAPDRLEFGFRLIGVFAGCERFEDAQRVLNGLARTTADPGEVLERAAERYSSTGFHDHWEGEPYVSLENFEDRRTPGLIRWTSGATTERRSVRQRVVTGSARAGLQAELLDISYGRHGTHDLWRLPRPYRIAGRRTPFGIRCSVRSESGTVHLSLVANLQLPDGGSGTIPSSWVDVGHEWARLEIRIPVERGGKYRYLDLIGINTGTRDLEIVVDDFELFSY